METEKMKLESHSMTLKTDDRGLVKEEKTARLEEVDEQTTEVVFVPAFDIDPKNLNPEIARQLEARNKTRMTDSAIARRRAEKEQEGPEI